MNQVNPSVFFESLFQSVPSSYWFECRWSASPSFGEKGFPVKRIWNNNISDWISSVKTVCGTMPHTVHFGVAPRLIAGGKAKDVAGTSSLWVDIDDMPFEVFRAKYFSQLRNLKLMPTFSIGSGWGTHLYWVLDSFLEDVKEIEICNRFLCWLVGGDMQSTDMAHLLRVPGSYNCKGHPFREVVPFLSGQLVSYKHIVSLRDQIIEKMEMRGDSKLRSIIMLSNKKNPTNRPFGEKIFIDVSSILKKLNKIKPTCPLLEIILSGKQQYSYKAWFALGCALNQMFDKDSAEASFHSISSIYSPSYSQDECAAKWLDIIKCDYFPSGCEKIPDVSRCPKIAKKECTNIIRVFQQTFKYR